MPLLAPCCQEIRIEAGISPTASDNIALMGDRGDGTDSDWATPHVKKAVKIETWLWLILASVAFAVLLAAAIL